MLLLRPARMDDLAGLTTLAAHLDSPNLPADAAFLRARIARSERAFASGGPPSADREYQLVLVDPAGAVVGASAILSKHGTPGMPHVFLRVCEERREASSINVRVHHRTLQLGATEDGPTEIGALVLAPGLRGAPGSPGKLLSWGRFAYIALHRDRFEDSILAEMRASLTPDGRNRFWEVFGRRFTGLSYAEADRRSASDKSFILDLFPSTPFYATLLDEEVSAELGRVHPEARPALRLLERAGFRWIGEIDPFDAGPFYGARQSEIVPIAELARFVVSDAPVPADAEPAIVATEHGGQFRAVATPASARGDALCISPEARMRLGISAGDPVARTRLPLSVPAAREADVTPKSDEATHPAVACATPAGRTIEPRSAAAPLSMATPSAAKPSVAAPSVVTPSVVTPSVATPGGRR
jgi:arginine N-succinyltransferase